MQKNILLIGFMGVGKGTIARAFAKRYDIFNIDTDDLIESYANKDIKKIFSKKGEKHFRVLEQKAADWLKECVSGTLISCGGGFYQVSGLNKIGKVVLLDASFEWIYNGLKNAKKSKQKLAKRPLFGDIVKAQKLYEQREQDYKRVADHILHIENKCMDEVCNELACIADMPISLS